jgi:hypothetical protein
LWLAVVGGPGEREGRGLVWHGMYGAKGRTCV